MVGEVWESDFGGNFYIILKFVGVARVIYPGKTTYITRHPNTIVISRKVSALCTLLTGAYS